MTTGGGRTQSIEFRLQTSYVKNAVIHRCCIRVVETYTRKPTTIYGGRRPSDTSTATATLGHKLALFVDDQYIDEHVVGARHLT